VKVVEGDRHIIDRLEAHFGANETAQDPFVFNYAYGVQGRLRYAHIPGILEMLGIPYLGSNPLAQSVSSDKAIAKRLFRYHGLPTPDFAVVDPRDYRPPTFAYPLVAKPVGEAASLGVALVADESQLRTVVDDVWSIYHQPTLVEAFLEGREINVSVIGNDPVLAMTPVEVVIEGPGPLIYTHLDKHYRSGRTARLICPAPIPPPLDRRARELAIAAFHALACEDWARVDLRTDSRGELHVLEVNSIPTLGHRGSYMAAARDMGWDLSAVVRRLVDVAVERYRSLTPEPVEQRDG
jgi:D-alanine-D-alanine ligase